MDQKVEEAIKFVHAYAPSIKEWKVLKKELLKALHPSFRKMFSTRDPRTKVSNFNQFENDIVECWKKLTGTELYLGKP